MGIHFSAYYVGERITIEDGMGPPQVYLEKEDHPTFDGLRYRGDTEFNNWVEKEYLHEDPENPDFEHAYWRPKDINSAVGWLLDQDFSTDRLLKLMAEMVTNPNLYLHTAH
jgi:hypothetical protein